MADKEGGRLTGKGTKIWGMMVITIGYFGFTNIHVRVTELNT